MKPAFTYLALITLAEILTATIDTGADFVRLGLTLHSLLLVALILHGAVTRQTQTRRLLLTLTLAPLIRILSVSLPLQHLPLVYWYLIIGALLYLAVFVTAQVTGISRQRMGLTWKDWPGQLGIALIGFALGGIEFFILGSRPLIESLSWETLLFPAFVLIVFTGFLEEIIFRGLLQDVATTLMGRLGIGYGALLFAVLHIGYLSFVDVLFVFGVGLLFGMIVQRTRSLLGVSLAHGFTNVSLYLICPFLFAGGVFSSQPPPPPQELPALPATVIPPPRHTPALALFVTLTPDSTLPALSPTATLPTPTATLTPSLTPAQPTTTALPCHTPPGWVVYLVRPGDTLSGISRAFQVTLSALQNANCLTGTAIFAGRKLYVPFTPTLATETLAPMPETDTPVPTPTAAETDTPSPPTDTDTPLPPAPTDTPISVDTDAPDA